MAKAKRNKGQSRILEEIKNQLILTAERWGQSGHYTPIKLEEMVLEQCKKIKGDFLSEKANLDYELNSGAENEKESRVKIDKIRIYLKKADRSIKTHQNAIKKVLDKMVGDREKVLRVMGKVLRKPAVSLLLGEN